MGERLFTDFIRDIEQLWMKRILFASKEAGELKERGIVSKGLYTIKSVYTLGGRTARPLSPDVLEKLRKEMGSIPARLEPEIGLDGRLIIGEMAEGNYELGKPLEISLEKDYAALLDGLDEAVSLSAALYIKLMEESIGFLEQKKDDKLVAIIDSASLRYKTDSSLPEEDIHITVVPYTIEYVRIFPAKKVA